MLPKVREQGRLVIIFPRKKMGEVSRGTDAVWLSVEVLNTLFDFSLPQAAKHLVISPVVQRTHRILILQYVLWPVFIGQIHNCSWSHVHSPPSALSSVDLLCQTLPGNIGHGVEEGV